MSEISRKMYGILALVLVIAGASIGAVILLQPTEGNGDGDTNTELSIKVIGLSTSKEFNLSEMQGETTILRSGSFQNSYGNIRGAGEYKGVLVSALIDAVGGMGVNDTLTVKAVDGYSQTFSYSKVYPNATIYGFQGDMVIAYQYNESVVPDYEDGFRLVFLPEDGYYSNADANASTDPNPVAAGPQCVSNVATIIVNSGANLLSVNFEDTTLYYSLAELIAFDSETGEGGLRKTTGTLVGPDTYTGVPVAALLSQLGELPANYSLTVKASDGWTTELTKRMVDGIANGYSQTGDPLGDIPCTMILAYEINSERLPSDDGPLRIGFLNADGNLTDGPFWAKKVVNITVVEIPTAPSVLLTQETIESNQLDLWTFAPNLIRKNSFWENMRSEQGFSLLLSRVLLEKDRI